MRALNEQSIKFAAYELSARDSALADIVDRLGPPPLWDRKPGFSALIQIILEQQISLAAARTVYRKLDEFLGGITPQAVFAAGEEGLKNFGLTRQKARYCHALAKLVLAGEIDLEKIEELSDNEGRRKLLSVPGLGPWSVDIYFLMALGRPDIWPEGDLALAVTLREIKALNSLPTRAEQKELTARWAPWRSVAARILWAHYLDSRGQYTA